MTDAVHAAGGRIITQLWHTSAISQHPDTPLGGARPLSACVDPNKFLSPPQTRSDRCRGP